jgi:AcrR family transcriptional regulator
MSADKRNAKSEIIEKACDFFIEKGFHATTTREITDSLNLSPGALYVHFKNKEEIFEVVIREFHPWRQIPEVVNFIECDSLDKLISQSLKKLEEQWAKRPELIRLHLIEIVEFNGLHLPSLFEEIFNETSKIVYSKKEGNESLNQVTNKVIDRALLGLFFGYTMLDRSISGIPQNADPFIQSYFTDSYLHGIINFGNGGDDK